MNINNFNLEVYNALLENIFFVNKVVFKLEVITI